MDKENKSKDSIGTTHILSKDTQHYATLRPLYYQSWFWILQIILALIALLYFLKIRVPAAEKKMPRWNLKNAQKLLSEIAEGGDVGRFYRTAIEILDQKLSIFGIRGQHHSEQIAQLRARDVKHLKWLESFWAEADAIAFGQSQVDGKHLKHQLEKLMLFLQQK
jgi:type II secretory pathway component PulF